jgi:hypothetical protein
MFKGQDKLLCTNDSFLKPIYRLTLKYMYFASTFQPTGTNIPQGDREKVSTKLTTQQQSFPINDSSGSKAFNKNVVMGKLGLTNFRLDDGHGTWNTYQSTHDAAYTPMPANSKFHNHLHRNALMKYILKYATSRTGYLYVEW